MELNVFVLIQEIIVNLGKSGMEYNVNINLVNVLKELIGMEHIVFLKINVQ